MSEQLLQTWMGRMKAALAARGLTTQQEWIAEYPGEHCWFRFGMDRDWISCVCCGVIRRKDGQNKPCKGIVRIGLRGDG